MSFSCFVDFCTKTLLPPERLTTLEASAGLIAASEAALHACHAHA